MPSAVLDVSAVLALIRDEPGADAVAEHVGRAAVSAVTLHEVVEELMASGLDEPVIHELVAELRLEVRAHDTDAAYAGAALQERTKRYGRGLGDCACLALGLALGVPVLTADREWERLEVEELKIEVVR